MLESRFSVVIATRDRADVLADCLSSLAAQTRPPTRIVVADSSRDDATRDMTERFLSFDGGELVYHRCSCTGASAQRNEALSLAVGPIVFFLDDDVVCEPAFCEEILRVFEGDPAGEIGGVSGTIVNQVYATPSRVSRAFMRWMAGRAIDDFGGRIIGPAWNQLPPDTADGTRDVDWLPSGCVAYRAEVLARHRFNEAFGEYSYAEDVHLSARVGREKRLVNTGRARLYHKDLGTRSHKNFRMLGRAQVVNRWCIMRDVLNRTRYADRAKLAALQLYFGASELRACLRTGGWARATATWGGRIRGLWEVFADGASAGRRCCP